MRIGFHNPYFDGFGGGERYTLTLASHWSKTHDVFLFWNDPLLPKIAQQRFGIDLSRVKTTQNIFQKKNILEKLFLSRQYDLIFFLTDGSIPTSFARYNILHFQVPFAHIEANPLKLSRFQKVVCNSLFTKTHLDARVGSRAVVIYPPVATGDLHAGIKKKQILSVGRFSSFFQSKKQQVLIEAFKKGLSKGKFSGWKLIFAGGLLPGDRDFFVSLKKQSQKLPVEFVPNIPYSQLTHFYEESTIYWHAAGFGESDPVLAEHFGISTVEAMAAGCVPVVYNGGGQPEIVEHGKNGFLWSTISELINDTVTIASQRPLYGAMQKQARMRAKDFDEKRFTKSFDVLLQKIA